MNQAQFFCRVINRQCYNKPLLPAEYQQVEYLEATGSQFINTGVQPSQPYIKCKFKTNSTSASCIWGTNVSSAQNYCSMSFYSNNLYVTTNREYNIGNTYDTNVHYVEYNTPDGKILIDGIVKIIDITAVSITSPICVGARGMGTGSVLTLNGRIYEFSVYDKSVSLKVFDGIPCYRKSDNKPGMYCLVTNTFFTNAGTGEFTVGNNI